jgi:hypothetical protein
MMQKVFKNDKTSNNLDPCIITKNLSSRILVLNQSTAQDDSLENNSNNNATIETKKNACAINCSYKKQIIILSISIVTVLILAALFFVIFSISSNITKQNLIISNSSLKINIDHQKDISKYLETIKNSN